MEKLTGINKLASARLASWLSPIVEISPPNPPPTPPHEECWCQREVDKLENWHLADFESEWNVAVQYKGIHSKGTGSASSLV